MDILKAMYARAKSNPQRIVLPEGDEPRTLEAANIILELNYNLMNKTELINAVAEKSGLTKADSKKAVDAITAAITDALKSGDKVSLVGFGTFSVKANPAREGINPLTKKKITIAAKKVAKFKAGSELNDAVK
jgi:DNA-binding protein HU-beta